MPEEEKEHCPRRTRPRIDYASTQEAEIRGNGVAPEPTWLIPASFPEDKVKSFPNGGKVVNG
jgi:hypothetical protein